MMLALSPARTSQFNLSRALKYSSIPRGRVWIEEPEATARRHLLLHGRNPALVPAAEVEALRSD